MARWIWIITVSLLLSSCSMTGSKTTMPVLIKTIEPALTPSVPDTAPTVTPSQPEREPCAFVWANQELPEISEELAQAFTQANLTGVQEARASAYGENCLTAGGKVQSFHAMQTDFYLVILVESTADTNLMGEWVAKVFPVLDLFPPGKVPGPNLGYVGIRFTGPAAEQNLWFRQQAARDLLQKGMRHGELFDALTSP